MRNSSILFMTLKMIFKIYESIKFMKFHGIVLNQNITVPTANATRVFEKVVMLMGEMKRF